MRIVVKVLKSSSTIMHVLKRWSIRVYVPTPPPFLERGIAELVFRRAAYAHPFEDQAIS